MIGIYDSGIGGLGIFNAVKQLLPNEHITYYGDTANFPYGDKPADAVREWTLQGLKHLASVGCNLVVIACNTASVNDIEYYRSNVLVPVIAVVPVIKTAAALTKNNQIALLATTATTKAAYTDQLIQQFAEGKQVNKIACPGLASEIEYGTLTNPKLITYLGSLGEADVVVLGCTHYTLIKGQIQRLVGPDVKVVDSNEAVARQTLRVLQANKTLDKAEHPNYEFDCSGNKTEFLEQVDIYTKI